MGGRIGRLHSRETAGKMGEAPTGNARALAYQHAPIVRMTNTCMLPLRSLVNAMDLSSGENFGLSSRDGEFVSRVAAPPAVGTAQSSPAQANASVLPSDDRADEEAS